MTQPRLCKDCRWHWAREATSETQNFDKCRNPEVTHKFRLVSCPERPDLVDGRDYPDVLRYCSVERASDSEGIGSCGRAGKLWEAKP